MVKSILEKISPTGFIKDYISYASNLTDAPLEFHLGGALTALATVCGSKIIYPGYGGRRQWPNLYTLLIAPSGLFRKSTSVGIAEDLIAEVDADLILSGEQSREKFLSLLKTNPNVLYPISEFAAVLAMWNRDYAQGFREIIVDLFDCRQEYSRQTLKDGKMTIHRPALNILAASTLDWLKEKLTEGDLRGGLMGRFIIIPGETKAPDPGLKANYDEEAKTKLINYLKNIRKLENSWVDVTHVLTEYNEWVRKAEGIMAKQFNPELLGFQSRLASHVLKLMVLLRVSDSPEPLNKYILQNDDFERAVILGRWLIDQATVLAETGFVKSKTEQSVQKLLSLASRNGGVSRHEAMRMMHVTSREFDNIVQTAIERGELRVEREIGAKTKPALFYLAVKRDNENEML
ncbi:MAG: DUF3987 domain-containing protein [Dehalococcoidales bacterium]|nr:DUF3987 domain-containing protein [Dehalococcoidales bacterium]